MDGKVFSFPTNRSPMTFATAFWPIDPNMPPKNLVTIIVVDVCATAWGITNITKIMYEICKKGLVSTDGQSPCISTFEIAYQIYLLHAKVLKDRSVSVSTGLAKFLVALLTLHQR